MTLVMHVDDMIIAGSSRDCEWLRAALSKSFPVNNLGPLTWYTGCAFERDSKSKTVKIVQTAYIEKIVDRFEVRKTSSNPASASVKLRARVEGDAQWNWPFREACGSLM